VVTEEKFSLEKGGSNENAGVQSRRKRESGGAKDAGEEGRQEGEEGTEIRKEKRTKSGIRETARRMRSERAQPT